MHALQIGPLDGIAWCRLSSHFGDMPARAAVVSRMERVSME